MTDQVSWTADASLGWANLKRGACHSSHPTEPPLSLGTALHTEQSAFDQHQDPKWYNPAMCGRFYLTATPAELKKMFKVDYLPELVPRYNIAPAQLSPIVIPTEKGRSIHMARWGLVPSWSRDLSLGVGMINAPVETLIEACLPNSFCHAAVSCAGKRFL